MVILFIGFGGFSYFQKSKQKPIEYTEVKRQNLISTVSTSGTLTGKKSANLHFKVAGKLASLNVKTGDQIEAGEMIASLDSTQLSISLQQAKNNLEDKQATLEKVLDDIHLFQYGNGGFSNVGSANETESQRAARITAQQAVNNAFDSVRAAQALFQDVEIFSPISGLVTKADPTSGVVISPTDLIVQVVDTSELFFDSEVDESDISKIKLGENVKVTLNAYPDKEFRGTVSEIKPTTKTAQSGATVVIVRILLTNPGINFISDLNGQAEIDVAKSSNVLTIPADSLIDDKFVYIPEVKGFKKVEVKTGISSNSDIEIKEGLSEHQKIVKNPSSVNK